MKWLGTMEVVGYTWTVLASTDEEVRRALRAEYKRALATNQVWGAAGDEDPVEYFGAHITEMSEGKVEWL